MAYAMELRVAVARAYEDCGSSIEVAEMFGVSESWVRRLIQRQRESGSLAPRPPHQPDTSKLDQQDLEQLRKLIERKPDLTLSELAEQLDRKVSVPTVWRATQRLGLSLKKRPATPPSRTGPTSRKNASAGSSSSRTCR